MRALSKPLSSQAPDTFQTRAWNRRVLNTQLASWTQLRHDTLLYVKQSFTPPLACEFPDGYVDPYPELWQRLSDIALTYRDFINNFEFTGTMWLERESFIGEELLPTDVFSPDTGYPPGAFGRTRQFDLEDRLTAMTDHLENFSAKCLFLKEIATHQLNGLPHTQAMKDFLGNTVEDFEVVGYGSERRCSGWFPGLYFENIRGNEFGDHPSNLWNPVVVDVHTDGADTLCFGDPGGILHEGTGRVQFMLTAVKHPDGSTCTYGGPVMSHYEFTTPLGTRLSDEEWKNRLYAGTEPGFAPWKHEFLVPVAPE